MPEVLLPLPPSPLESATWLFSLPLPPLPPLPSATLPFSLPLPPLPPLVSATLPFALPFALPLPFPFWGAWEAWGP